MTVSKLLEDAIWLAHAICLLYRPVYQTPDQHHSASFIASIAALTSFVSDITARVLVYSSIKSGRPVQIPGRTIEDKLMRRTLKQRDAIMEYWYRYVCGEAGLEACLPNATIMELMKTFEAMGNRTVHDYATMLYSDVKKAGNQILQLANTSGINIRFEMDRCMERIAGEEQARALAAAKDLLDEHSASTLLTPQSTGRRA